MLKDIAVSFLAGQPRNLVFAESDYCLPKISGIVGLMQTHPHWARLAAAVKSARGLRTQKAVAEAGGPSDTTIGKIEANEWRPKRGVDETLSKLDKGLGWEPGSAQTVLAGGDPTPLRRRGDLGRGLASLIPASAGGRGPSVDTESDDEIAYRVRQKPTNQSREAWIRSGERLAHARPLIPFADANAKRRELAQAALEKTFGKDTAPTSDTLRMMRELIEERELDTLIDRIELLDRPSQLEISAYVDDLLRWGGVDAYPDTADVVDEASSTGVDAPRDSAFAGQRVVLALPDDDGEHMWQLQVVRYEEFELMRPVLDEFRIVTMVGPQFDDEAALSLGRSLLADELKQDDYDLAGGERTAPHSEGRRRREEQDRDAEEGHHDD